jgi:hypothetical protein
VVGQRAMLTKDNMKKRKWKGETRCYFYGQFETNNHLLFECPIAKVVFEGGGIALCFHQKNRPSNYDQPLGVDY